MSLSSTFQSRDAFPSQGSTGDLTERKIWVKFPQNVILSLHCVNGRAGVPAHSQEGKLHIPSSPEWKLTHQVLGNAELFTYSKCLGCRNIKYSEMPAWSRLGVGLGTLLLALCNSSLS